MPEASRRAGRNSPGRRPKAKSWVGGPRLRQSPDASGLFRLLVTAPPRAPLGVARGYCQTGLPALGSGYNGSMKESSGDHFRSRDQGTGNRDRWNAPLCGRLARGGNPTFGAAVKSGGRNTLCPNWACLPAGRFVSHSTLGAQIGAQIGFVSHFRPGTQIGFVSHLWVSAQEMGSFCHTPCTRGGLGESPNGPRACQSRRNMRPK